MNILIVDDENDKIAKIVSEVRNNSASFQIDSAIDVAEAQRKLAVKKYDLLIVDLLLPLTNGAEPSPEGGATLVKELSRNRGLISPSYIFGLTQYEEEMPKFSIIWKVAKYDPASENWSLILRELLHYISKSINAAQANPTIIPQIYLEGITDKKLLEDAIKLFKPCLAEQFDLKAERRAGASWVTRKLVIWSHSLFKGTDGTEIKSLGLYDNDMAGKDAIAELSRIIRRDSAEAKTYKIISLTATFARHLIPLAQKGVIIPVTLEAMFTNEHWKYAESQGWLEDRSNPEDIINEPRKWNKYRQSFLDYLKTCKLTEDEILFTKKIKASSKEDFTAYILHLPEEQRKLAYCSFPGLIEEICQQLSVNC